MNKIPILLFMLIIFVLNKFIIVSANDDTYINSNNIIYNEKENVVELSENSKINFKNINILIDKRELLITIKMSLRYLVIFICMKSLI